MLAAWYPLISDCHNQGVLNAELTEGVSGATFGPGILGGCLTNCGRCYWDATTTASILNNDAMTFAFWIYPTDATGTSRTQEIFGNTSTTASGGRKFTIYQYPTCNDLHLSWQNEASIDAIVAVIYKGVFPSNTWTHCCITYQNPNGKVYINGQLYTTFTGKYNSSTFAYKTQALVSWSNRKLCDFRIYTHCLSALEVKQISQALILHYPMTGGGRSGDNLVVGTQRNQYSTDLTLDNDRKSGMLSAGSGGNGVFSITEEEVPVGIYSYNVTNNTSGNRDYQQGGIPFISGKQYTASWWAKGNGSCLFRSWNRTRGAEVIRDTYTLTSNWKYYTRTFTATQAMQDDCCTFHLGVTGNASIKIAGMKLEEGSHATPWMPNSADTAYTTMGYNTNTEYDTSGYLHNGSISGSVGYSSDTARYSVSTEFSKSGFISVPSFNIDTSAFTLNFWVKMKTATSQHFVLGTFTSWTGNGIGVYRDANAEWYSCIIRSAGESTYKGFSLYPTIGSWYMLTLTYDGTNYKGYLNGVLKQNVTYGSGGVVSNPVFMVGNSKFNSTPSSENEEAFVSDVRFYATALSATQIAELYNTSASISNNGILLGYELVES